MRARKLVKDKNTGKQNIVFFGSYGVNKYYYESPSTRSTSFYIKREELLINPDGSITLDFDILVEQLYTYQGDLYFSIALKRNDETIKWVFTGYKNVQKNIKTNLKITIDKTSYENIDFNILYVGIGHASSNIKLSVDLNLHSKKAAPNYSEKQEGVKDALIPRLSVLKGELWYKISYGLPLMEKIKSKGIYDSIIIKYITDYPDVVNIEEFSSTLDKDTHKYTFDCIINTIYGEKINLSNK